MKRTEKGIDVVRGTANIFHDFGHADAELRHLKCQLAAEIIGVLDENGWTVRQAQKKTAFDAGDFLVFVMQILRGSPSIKWSGCRKS